MKGGLEARTRSPRGLPQKMFSALRSRLTYANIVATLALVLSMSGGALAAQRYLVSSTNQLGHGVIATMKHRNGKQGKKGRKGPGGPAGSPGTQGATGAQGIQGPLGAQPPGRTGPEGVIGERGATGTAGAPGGASAVTFSASVTPPNVEATAHLFSLPGGLSAQLFCLRAIFTFGGIDVFAPTGSRAEARLVAINPRGEPPETTSDLIEDVQLNPEGELIALLLSNTPAHENVESNRAHIDGTILTESAVIHLDAFLQVAPLGSPRTCTVHGSAADYPR